MHINHETGQESGRATPRRLYIESYGCQMNFSDSEIVVSILQKNGFETTPAPDTADIVLLNTCAIRDKAEQTIRHRLEQIHGMKKRNPQMIVGVLGCMAERMKTSLLEEEQVVDLIAGPDAYRDLPRLIAEAENGSRAANIFLSREETYDDVEPVRLHSNEVTAFISIMRGCDNMCSFCVVPFTRGRERSRDPESIVREARNLFEHGYREVTLLGQNVDSYKWSRDENNRARLDKASAQEVVSFAQLLEHVAAISPDLRIRFSTSHPKDMTDDVLHTMRRHDNICKHIHLPVQSGSDRILGLMNRGYTRAWYLSRIDRIRALLGDDCAISSDMISGFCGETAAEHGETLALMDAVRYDSAFMFAYSERPGTPAAKRYTDDVPLAVKKDRLNEIIAKQRAHSHQRNRRELGKVFRVLVEGPSRRSNDFFQGRTSSNKVVVFDRAKVKKGAYVDVRVTDCTPATLLGQLA